MQRSDFKRFSTALIAVGEVFEKELSEGALQMWWKLMEDYAIDDVERALHACLKNTDSGHFMPKPSDVVRILTGGTHGDRAQIAWGNVLMAMSSVGAYSDAVFDDAAIHATVEDMGGWPKLCRTETKELGYLQHRFCASHKAYTTKGGFDYPKVLIGDRDPDSAYLKKGLPAPKTALIGNELQCMLVMRGGSASGRTAITFNSHLLGVANSIATIARAA